MTLDLAKLRAETLPDRLRGIYRIPITDGLGPAGGEEPYNPDVFVRRFDTPPIQHEAADEIERLTAENETAVRRSAEWMRNRIAALARQTAVNIIAESAGGPRHRRGYEAGRAAAFEIMARTILAVPLPANGAALAEGGPDDR